MIAALIAIAYLLTGLFVGEWLDRITAGDFVRSLRKLGGRGLLWSWLFWPLSSFRFLAAHKLRENLITFPQPKASPTPRSSLLRRLRRSEYSQIRFSDKENASIRDFFNP